MVSRDKNKKWIANVFLLLLSLILLIPFYIVAVNAFKTNIDIETSPLSIPFSRLTFANFKYAFESKSFNIFHAYWTTIWITVSSGFFVILFSSMISFIIARSKNKWIRGLYWYFLCGLMIPPAVTLIPAVQILKNTHLIHTIYGLIVLNVANYLPFSMFIYTGFIRTITEHIDESAKIDGAGTFTIFWRIIFPLLKPATGTVCIFIFLWVWNDFLNPLIVLGPMSAYTITTGLYYSIGQYNTHWNDVFSMIFLSMLPVFLVFIFMQRSFMDGLVKGAVKG